MSVDRRQFLKQTGVTAAAACAGVISAAETDRRVDANSQINLAAIGTGEAFDRGRDFGAWLGLVPRQYSTGGKPILGRISKRGSRYLRTLFVQAAHIILMRPHNWKKFSFGPWLEQASGRMHKNKLAAALANKLARIAWSVLRNGKKFDSHRFEASAI